MLNKLVSLKALVAHTTEGRNSPCFQFVPFNIALCLDVLKYCVLMCCVPIRCLLIYSVAYALCTDVVLGDALVYCCTVCPCTMQLCLVH